MRKANAKSSCKTQMATWSWWRMISDDGATAWLRHIQDGRPSMALTLQKANRVIQAAIAKARELNVSSALPFAMPAAAGRFQRMDNAIWASTLGSQGQGGRRASKQ
jgi:hypothetical protein